jgi:hypothetical protein
LLGFQVNSSPSQSPKIESPKPKKKIRNKTKNRLKNKQKINEKEQNEPEKPTNSTEIQNINITIKETNTQIANVQITNAHNTKPLRTENNVQITKNGKLQDNEAEREMFDLYSSTSCVTFSLDEVPSVDVCMTHVCCGCVWRDLCGGLCWRTRSVCCGWCVVCGVYGA